MPQSEITATFVTSHPTLSRPRESAPARVLGGSLIMLFSSTAVSGINFITNVVMARLLGPSLFGQIAVATTLLMLASCIPLAYQMVCAKFVARNESAGGKAAVYRGLLKSSWRVSLSLGLEI